MSQYTKRRSWNLNASDVSSLSSLPVQDQVDEDHEQSFLHITSQVMIVGRFRVTSSMVRSNRPDCSFSGFMQWWLDIPDENVVDKGAIKHVHVQYTSTSLLGRDNARHVTRVPHSLNY